MEEPKPKKILIILLCLVVMLAALVFLTLKLISGPANGVVLEPANNTVEKPDVRLTSSFLSLAYPARYEPAQTQNASASLKSWTIVAHQESRSSIGAKFSIVITALPTGGVKEDSAYNLFKSRPETYNLKPTIFGKDNGYTAVRSDNAYQKTILWPHGKYLLTISQTSGSSSETLNNEMDSIIKSVIWNE